jgi:hypothetical protein
MLWVVLAAVAAAFGLLVVALTSGDMLFAWLSVAASAAAAIVLIVDWSRRRAQRRALPDDAGPIAGPLVPEASDPDTEPDTEPEPGTGTGTESEPAESEPAEPALVDDAEPAEEDTDAADVLIVSESRLEVRVVDERPRYHLSTCAWLADRGTLPLPVGEARELGFTPCAVCAPDRALAAQTRRTTRT